jgi:uncharacterized protein
MSSYDEAREAEPSSPVPSSPWLRARPEPLVIGGQAIARGERRDLQLKFSESYLGVPVSVPIFVNRSAVDGPRVFMAAAIHGDELNGLGIVREFVYDKTPDLLCGTLICIPVVNIYGLERHSRYMPDRRDLNRCFPGTPYGSLASRLANAIFEEIVKQCDLGIDFHTAAVRMTNYPNVRAELSDPNVRKVAMAFGCEVVVDSKGPTGSLRRTAVAAGIPTIIYEAGEVWKIEPGVVEVGVRGCMNLLRYVGMLAGEPAPPVFQTLIEHTTWVRAEQGGIISFHARPGELVKEGESLATAQNIFGRERSSMRAPVGGIVLGMTTMPAVKPGQPVYHLAVLPSKAVDAIDEEIKDAADGMSYTRLRDDLSTNIIIRER